MVESALVDLMRCIIIICILFGMSSCAPTNATRSGMRRNDGPSTEPSRRLTESDVVTSFLSAELDFYEAYSKILDARTDEASAAHNSEKWEKYVEAKRVLIHWQELVLRIGGRLEEGAGLEIINDFRERLGVKVHQGFAARTDANNLIVELFAAGVDVRMYLLKVIDDGPPPLRPFPFNMIGGDTTGPTTRGHHGEATTRPTGRPE